MNWADVRGWFIHLRLGFQLLLSPIFLWGLLLGGGQIDISSVIGFISFHLFGYAGGTAFNSFFDQDVGPVGGLAHPPPIPRGLLPFSLFWQTSGLVLAAAVNLPFTAIYLSMFLLSVLYSHPRSRFKGKPVLALATVAVGQGFLAYLGGWACARGEILSALTFPGLAGAGASIGITLGLYPLTEIYQLDEDRERGDRTMAIWLGPARSFRFAQALLAFGGLAAIGVVLARYRIQEAGLIALFVAAILISVERWSARFGHTDMIGNFHSLMRLYTATCLGFTGWIALHLLGWL